MDKLLNEVTSAYSIDANRIYLTGVSLGGNGTWSYAVNSKLKFTIYENGGHSIWDNVYCTPELYDWLFEQTSLVK